MNLDSFLVTRRWCFLKCSTQCLSTEYIWQVKIRIWRTRTNQIDFLDFILLISSLFHSFDFKSIYCQWLIHFVIMNILFSINECWPFKCDMIFFLWKVKGVWRFTYILFPNKFETFLMYFMRCYNTWCIFGKSDVCLALVSFYIHAVLEHRVYIWKVCVLS